MTKKQLIGKLARRALHKWGRVFCPGWDVTLRVIRIDDYPDTVARCYSDFVGRRAIIDVDERLDLTAHGEAYVSECVVHELTHALLSRLEKQVTNIIEASVAPSAYKTVIPHVIDEIEVICEKLGQGLSRESR